MSASANVSIRIILDILLIGLLITLFNKNEISLMYHEIAGLVFLVPVCIHLLFNWTWVNGVIRKFVRTGLHGKTRVLMAVNILLTLSWTAVMVTGVLSSKKLFPFGITALIPWHFFVSALALILTGVHFGLNWNFFREAFVEKLRLSRSLAICLAAVMIGVGCYSAVTTNFGRWISAPFVPRPEHTAMHTGTGTESAAALESMALDSGEKGALAKKDHVNPDRSQIRTGRRQSAGRTASDRGSAAAHGDAGAFPGVRLHSKPFSWTSFLAAVSSCFSLFFLFAAVALALEKLMKRRRQENSPC